VIATTLGAYVRIPIKGSPVPITLQTFFVLLSGAVLGKRLGLLSQLTYLSLGIFGMPVFQGYSFGILHLVGPTGGYLIGFLGASFVVGSIMDKVSLSRYWTVLAFLAGNFIIYLFGATWLAYVYRMSISHAIAIGILPFIPGDLIKIALASLVYMRTSKRVRQIFTL
jgi:biotin transport system substrate-specific component